MIERTDLWPPGGGEMGARIRGHDWAATPLGPVEAWPSPLRTTVEIMLASPGPILVVWGPERTHLYNDAYIPIAAHRHPGALGRGAVDLWPDDHQARLGPTLNRVFRGEAVAFADLLLASRPPGAEEVFGWTAAEAVGRSMDTTFTPEDRKAGAPKAE